MCDWEKNNIIFRDKDESLVKYNYQTAKDIERKKYY